MAVLDCTKLEKIVAAEDTQITFIGGEKLSKRFIYWNFVSSRKERIEQAMDDWENARFPKVPNDSEEFIPLPKK